MSNQQPRRAYHEVVIANGGTTSTAVDIGSETVVGFIFPASFEGATVTFTAAKTASGTYYPVIDNITGSSVTYYAGASKFTRVQPGEIACLQYFKVVSASSVGADRTIIIVTRPTA